MILEFTLDSTRWNVLEVLLLRNKTFGWKEELERQNGYKGVNAFERKRKHLNNIEIEQWP